MQEPFGLEAWITHKSLHIVFKFNNNLEPELNDKDEIHDPMVIEALKACQEPTFSEASAVE